eukprot:13753185-Alexandrium_andersonii.AAC.1
MAGVPGARRCASRAPQRRQRKQFGHSAVPPTQPMQRDPGPRGLRSGCGWRRKQEFGSPHA